MSESQPLHDLRADAGCRWRAMLKDLFRLTEDGFAASGGNLDTAEMTSRVAKLLSEYRRMNGGSCPHWYELAATMGWVAQTVQAELHDLAEIDLHLALHRVLASTPATPATTTATPEPRPGPAHVTEAMKVRLRERMMLHLPQVSPLHVSASVEQTAAQMDLAMRYFDALERGSDLELDQVAQAVGASTSGAMKALRAVQEQIADEDNEPPSA